MLFKMKLALCMMALTTAYYASAQEKTGQAPSTQSKSATSQADTTQTESPAKTGENQNRRRDRASENPDRSSPENANQKRDRRNETDRTRRSDVTVERSETRYGAAGDKPLDAQLASCLILGNRKEVAISQWASERTKNEKVKEFARQMVKDHGQAITMLQRFAGPDGSKELSLGGDATRINRSETTVNRSTTTTDANRPANENERSDKAASNPANRNADRENVVNRSAEANREANAKDRNREVTSTVQVRSEHEAMPDKLAAIEREAAEKCITLAKQELEQSSNFDQAFVGMQISSHIGMIAKLETYKSYASEDLGKVIQESLDTAQGHLRHAKELVMQISHDPSSSSRSSSSPSSSESKSRDASRSESSSRSDATNRESTRNPAKEGTDNKKDAPKN